MNEPIRLTTREVAQRFHLHPTTLSRWLARKNPKYPIPMKVGNKLLWPIEEIERFEKQARIAR